MPTASARRARASTPHLVMAALFVALGTALPMVIAFVPAGSRSTCRSPTSSGALPFRHSPEQAVPPAALQSAVPVRHAAEHSALQPGADAGRRRSYLSQHAIVFLIPLPRRYEGLPDSAHAAPSRLRTTTEVARLATRAAVTLSIELLGPIPVPGPSTLGIARASDRPCRSTREWGRRPKLRRRALMRGMGRHPGENGLCRSVAAAPWRRFSVPYVGVDGMAASALGADAGATTPVVASEERADYEQLVTLARRMRRRPRNPMLRHGEPPQRSRSRVTTLLDDELRRGRARLHARGPARSAAGLVVVSSSRGTLGARPRPIAEPSSAPGFDRSGHRSGAEAARARWRALCGAAPEGAYEGVEGIGREPRRSSAKVDGDDQSLIGAAEVRPATSRSCCSGPGRSERHRRR